MSRARTVLLISVFFAFVCVCSANAQDVSLLPTDLTFSSQAVGTTSGVRAITLTNTDDAHALTISTVVASGDFKQTNTCDSGVAAGKSCTISVQFAPTATGTIDGSVSIFDNAPGSPQVLGLTGTGIARVTISPSSLNFGTVPIGMVSAIKTVKLTNNTASSIAIASITASGDFSSVPAGTGGCGSILLANTSCTEDVFFTPTELGTVDGSVIFTDAGTHQYVTLAGKGTGTANSPITLTPPALAFGNQTIGSTSTVQSVTIKNTGATSLNLTFAASGSYIKSNPALGACSSSLAGGASCTINVQFSPAVLGAIDGSVSVNYSGANSPQVISLTGIGIGQVTLSPSSIAFLPQQVDTTSAVKKVTVTNNFSSAVSVSSIVKSADFTESNTCGTSIAVGKSCTISISFSPTRGGLVLGSVIITDSATNSPQIVDLSGSSYLESRFAYVANSNGTVSVYTVNLKTGQLRSNGYVFAGSVTVDPSGRFAYTLGSNSISAYTIDASTGELTTITGSPYPSPAGSGPKSITVDPSSKFVYVVNQDFNDIGGSISAYTVDGNTGALTAVGSPFATGQGPASMAIDPSGRFAYVNNEFDDPNGDISGYTIDATTGALTAMLGSPFLSASGAFAVAVAPSGEFGYVLGDVSPEQITAFSIDATSGIPTKVAGSPFTIGGGISFSMVIAPSGKFIYVVDGTFGGNDIVAVSVNTTTGALGPVSGSPFAAGDNPSSATVDPKGTLLYVTNHGSTPPAAGANEVWTYTIAGNGALTVLNKARTQQGPVSVALGGGSASVVYTPKFAYAANNGSNNVSAYTINASTGFLTPITGSPFNAGMSPVIVTTDPLGKFAYVVNNGSNNVSAYTINASTGFLTPATGSPFAAGTAPNSVAVDASGRFAYVANPQSQNISAYTIDSNTGALTAIVGSPYPTGAKTEPYAVTVDPTGQFVYVANDSLSFGTNGSIFAYTIDVNTGALTAITGSPFTPVYGPSAVTVDPSGKFLYVTNSIGDPTDYTVSGFAINAATGALSQAINPVIQSAVPVAITVDPSDRFVYVADIVANLLYIFSFDATNGDLNNPRTVPAFTNPNSVAVDASGKFVYAATVGMNDINVYVIDQSTGDLTGITGSPFNAGTNPYSVTTTGTIH